VKIIHYKQIQYHYSKALFTSWGSLASAITIFMGCTSVVWFFHNNWPTPDYRA
jgi:hypothetical protein